MGTLYKYKLVNGTTYVGRDLSDNSSTNQLRRAKDHFYNALVNAYHVGPYIYHYQESLSSFKFKMGSVQDMEVAGGRLMKNSHKTFSTFAKEFGDYKKFYGKKQIKQDVSKFLQSHIKIKKSIILQDDEQTKAGKQNGNDAHENEFQYTINTQDHVEYNIQNVGKQTLSDLEKEFKIKDNIKGRNIGLVSGKVKEFKQQDPYGNFIYQGTSTKSLNIITEIENITTTEGLRGTALGEYLLIALDLSTPKGFFTSLNREVGQYSKIYKNIVEKYQQDIDINKIQKGTGSKTDINKKISDEINKKLPLFKTYAQNFLQELNTHISRNNNKVNKTGEATISVDNLLEVYIKAGFGSKMNSDGYGQKSSVKMQDMLKECFKYSLITMNLTDLIKNSIINTNIIRQDVINEDNTGIKNIKIK